jgi:TM2 domain-containing membrane protein YozV
MIEKTTVEYSNDNLTVNSSFLHIMYHSCIFKNFCKFKKNILLLFKLNIPVYFCLSPYSYLPKTQEKIGLV